MADELPTPSAPETTEAAAPVTPVAESAPAVAPEAPAVQESTPQAAESATAPEPTSLLGDAAAPAPEPKAEATETKPVAGDVTAEKPESEAPAEEAPPEEAPLPTYDVFTVPEGVELEDERVDKFVGTLGSFERKILAEKDPAKIHAAVGELGQQMLDHYTEEVAQLGERVRQANAETFARTMENWKNDFFNDPEIGGNRRDTTLKNAGAVLNRFGGTPQQIAELRSVFSTTGAGNHKLVLNLFNNVADFLGEGRAVAGEKPEPQAGSRKERRYGKGN